MSDVADFYWKIKIFEFFFKDFAADIKRFHQEHKENFRDKNDDNLITPELLVKCSSLNSLNSSYNRLRKSSFAEDESKPTSMTALEDFEIKDKGVAPQNHSEEENARIHKGIFN